VGSGTLARAICASFCQSHVTLKRRTSSPSIFDTQRAKAQWFVDRHLDRNARPPDQGTWIHDCDELPTAHLNTTQPTLDAICTQATIPFRCVLSIVTPRRIHRDRYRCPPCFPPPQNLVWNWANGLRAGTISAFQSSTKLLPTTDTKDDITKGAEFISDTSIDVPFMSAVHGDRPLDYNDEATRSAEYSTVSAFVSLCSTLRLLLHVGYVVSFSAYNSRPHAIKR
jgi:hypothetical protein